MHDPWIASPLSLAQATSKVSVADLFHRFIHNFVGWRNLEG
jgi:hypothetical protein